MLTNSIVMFIIAFGIGAIFSYIVLALLVFKRKNDDIELEIQNFNLIQELNKLKKS